MPSCCRSISGSLTIMFFCLSLPVAPLAIAQGLRATLSSPPRPLAELVELKTARELQEEAMRLNDAGKTALATMTAQQALEIFKRIEGEASLDAGHMMSDLGLIFREQADYSQARSHLDRALTTMMAIIGPDHWMTATAIERLSVLLEMQADVPNARKHAERALSIRRKLLGEDHTSTANSLVFLGELMRLQGELDGARTVSEQALARCKKANGELHRDTAKAYSAMGDYFMVRGELENARPHYEQALAIRTKVLGEEHPETAMAKMRWGTLLSADGKHDEARSFLDNALEISRKTRGDDHPETAAVLNAIGHFHVNRSEFKVAIQEYEKVLSICKKRLNPEHHDTAGALLNLGSAFYESGDVKAAFSFTEQSLKILEKTWGTKHPDTAAAMYLMGNILYAQGDYAAAKRRIEIGLNAYENIMGVESDSAATGYYYLGMLGRAQKDFLSARKSYEKALAVYVKNHGQDFASSMVTRSQLGNALFEQGEYNDAKVEFAQVLAMRRRVSGNEHADTADAADMLGVVLYTQSDLVAARKYYEEALAIRRKLFGDEDLRTATSHYNLGLLHRAAADEVTARALFEKALAVRKKILGEEDESTKLVAKALSTTVDVPAPPALPVPPPAYPDPPRSLADNQPAPTPPSVNTTTSSSKATGSDLISARDLAGMTPARLAGLQVLVPQLEQAMTLYNKGRYKEFLPPAEKLSRELTEFFGPEHRVTALAIAMRGMAHNKLAEYDAALPLLEQSLALQLKLTGEQNLETASILIELADLFSSRNDLKKSNDYAARCLAVRKALLGENAIGTAVAIAKLGTNAMAAGDYEVAKNYLEKSIAIQTKALRPNDPDYENVVHSLAAATTSLALIQHLSGDVLQARKNYEAVLELRRKVLGDRHPDTAGSYVQMAVLHYSLGDMPMAQRYLEQAIAIFKSSMGDNHPYVAVTQAVLGEICIVRKDFSAARTHLEAAQGIQRRTIGENHPDYAQTLLTFGRLDQSIGNYAKARDYFDRANSLYEEVFGKDNFAGFSSIQNISKLLMLQGKYAEARPFAEKSIRLIQSSVAKDSFDMAAARGNLSEVLAGLNAWPDATDQMDNARRLVRRLAAEVLPGLSERELLQCLQHADEDFLHSALSMGLVRRDDQAVVDLSAGWLVNGKGIAQESLSQQQATRLAKREGTFSTATVASGKWVELDTVRKELPVDARLFDIARIRVRNFSSTTREEQWSDARYLAWVIPAHGSEAVHIVDLGDAESLDALVAEFNLAMKASMGNGRIKGTIEELGDVDAAKMIEKPLRALASRLIEPLRSDLEKSKKIILSPDSSLWLLPWATLPISDDRYLIEEHALQLVVSSRDLVRPKQTEAKLNPPVVMADPGFDLNTQQIQAATKAVLRAGYQPIPSNNSRSASLIDELPKVNRLPNTAIEAQAILPNLEQITKDKALVYIGEFALEGVFKKVKQPKMMVLSTHGVFLPTKQTPTAPGESFVSLSQKSENTLVGPIENPLLRCGLLLAGCNQRPVSQTDDDGILTGDEIVAGNLRGTEMVVLSACETGVGEVRNGDGVAGLRQAFQLAGAKSVVATLWMIEDRESALFMRDFFEHLGGGEPPADAMRNAQLERIEARRNRYGAAHPFYWAAWTLTGGSP